MGIPQQGHHGATLLGSVRSSRGAVTAGHPLAVRAGLEVLDEGGNAVDATIAAAFVAFVAEPNNAGIGGYGHLSAFLPGHGGFLTIDHSPRAPAAARADMFELDRERETEGHDWPSVVENRNWVGPLAVATPGAVSGLHALHERAGRLSWDRLLAPAVALAQAGLEVTWLLLIEIAARHEEIRANPVLAAIQHPDARPPRARTADSPGERLNQRDLAATLQTIAARGPRAFYDGSIAADIAAAVGGRGGILSAEDLAGYAPRIVQEPPARYRDLEYITALDTVGYEALGILEHFPITDLGAGTAAHYHLLAEAMGHAFADGAAHGGDPDFSEHPVHELGSAAFAAVRANAIRLDRAAIRPVPTAAPWLPADEPQPPQSSGGVHGTTQVVAADSDGNLVALITTIGADFGSTVTVPGRGIILNNSMINYDPRPGHGNSIAPGKMPFFAVPTLVATRDGTAAFAAAGSGGYPILAGVINTTVNHVDHGMDVQRAIDAPRVHSQGDRTFIDARVPATIRGQLEELGHELVVRELTPGELPFSRVSAIAASPTGIAAGAGPSWSTAAGGL
jgi:gamma-glutamyltranspeptidase/glutathione hydrolase